MFQLSHYIDQRRVERGVQQAKIVVMEGGHVRVPNKNPQSLTHYLQSDNWLFAMDSSISNKKQQVNTILIGNFVG